MILVAAILLLIVLATVLYRVFRWKYIVEPEIIARDISFIITSTDRYCDCEEPDWELDDSMGYRLRCKKCGREPG